MSASSPADCQMVPLFPLPNVVLFPRAVLPLHIFEERYKEMTSDVLQGDRRLAMALLCPGWEKTYYGRPAIEPVVCIGQILTAERLPDGKYNFLLRGQTRARIVRECSDKPYRIAQVQPMQQGQAMEIDLEDERRRLMELFTTGGLSTFPVAEQFRSLLAGPLATPDLADLVSFSFVDDAGTKQALLAESDPRQRLRRLLDTLGAIRAARSGVRGFPSEPGMN